MVFNSAVPIACSDSTEIKEMMMTMMCACVCMCVCVCVRARACAHVLENKFHISFSSCALVICENIIRHIIFFYALYKNVFVQFVELPVCGTKLQTL